MMMLLCNFLHCCGDVIVLVTGVLNVILGSIIVIVWQVVFGTMSLHLAGIMTTLFQQSAARCFYLALCKISRPSYVKVHTYLFGSMILSYCCVIFCTVGWGDCVCYEWFECGIEQPWCSDLAKYVSSNVITSGWALWWPSVSRGFWW